MFFPAVSPTTNIQFDVIQQGILEQWRPPVYWTVSAKAWPEGQGRWLFPSTWHLWDCIWSPMPSFGLLSMRKISVKAWVLLCFYPEFDASVAFAFSTATLNYWPSALLW